MFVQLLVTLFVVFFGVTLVTGIVSFVTVRSALAEQTYEHNLETLRQTSRIIEAVLDSTERMAVRLSQNRTVQSVSLADWGNIADHYPSLLQIRAMIEDELASSAYIHSIFLVSPTNERVLSASGILRLTDYPDSELRAYGRDGLAASTWVGPRTTTSLGGGTATVITLLMDVPVGVPANRGRMVVNLDERLFYDTVVRRNQREAGSLAILNEQSIVLSVADKSLLTERLTLADLYPGLAGTQEGYSTVRKPSGRHFVSIITSPYNGWHYVSATPYDTVMAASRRVIALSIGVSVLFLTLGLGLSVLVSRRFYRPIQSLIELLRAPNARSGLTGEAPGVDASDEFEMIHASINTLLHENREYQARYKATDAILREHFLIDLVLGRTKTRSDALREASEFGLDLEARCFAVTVLRIGADALETTRDRAQQRELRYRVYGIASGVLNRFARGFVVDFGKTDVVIGVLCDSDEPVAVCRTIAANVQKLIVADLGIGTSYGIGSSQSSYEHLSTSHDHAILALEYALSSESQSVVAIDDVVADTQLHSVILDYRKTIDEVTQAFRRQEYEHACDIADECTAAIVADTRLGRLHATMLYHELLSAFLSMLVSFDLDLTAIYGTEAHLFHDLAVKKHPEDVRAWMLNCIRAAAMHLSSRSSIRRRDFVGRIEQFVAEHYAEPVGLSDAAEHLHMNRQYFCSVFKTAFGTTFGEYLSRRRIEEATRLLESTTRPVGAIALEVGFSSARSFVRTFRAARGVTPTKYRVSKQMNGPGCGAHARVRDPAAQFTNTRH